jgi:hypothetical protein
VPVVRPFRALRYSPAAVGDMAAVVAPPYDVIGPDEHRRLLARDVRNVVRLDLPTTEPGDADPDDSYRRAARHLGSWRGSGILRRDPRPAVSVLEDTYHLPGRDEVHVRRGFFARVRLEPFGAGIRAHERTLTGPKEDRYKLLRATGVNTSPVVAMYEDRSGRAASLLEDVASTPPLIDVADEAGVRHRLWPVVAGDGTVAETLCDIASAATLTIADGHHRYETALRYARERRAGMADGVELDTDDVLMLLLEPRAGPIDVLPTHRVVLGLGAEGLAALGAGLAGFFDVDSGVSVERLLGVFGPLGGAAGGAGRFGLWTRAGGAILRAPTFPRAGRRSAAWTSRSSGRRSRRSPGSTLRRSPRVAGSGTPWTRPRRSPSSMPAPMAPTPPSSSSRPRPPRSWPWPPTATLCPRRARTSTPRP